MIYYWYKISTGEYMGHCEGQPGTDEYSSTTTKPPARDLDTQELRWTGTEWELEDASN